MRRPSFARNVGRKALLLWSAPVVVLVAIVVVKLISMVVAGNAAVDDFGRRDADALRADVSTLTFLDVVDPGATAYAEGALAVLEGRLEDAEGHFAAAVSDDPTCPALVDLTLVGETRGDQFVGVADGPAALDRYRAALTTVTDAPAECFADNDDPDAERRDVRARSEERLTRKIALLERPLPPPPNAPPPPPPAGGAPPPVSGSEQQADQKPDDPDVVERVLNPGDPLDQLGQLLLDGAAVRGAP